MTAGVETPPDVEGLAFARAGAVLHATIDRGDENLVTMAMCEALTAVLHDPPAGCHVLHLRAEGPNWCLGRERGTGDPDALASEARTLVACNRAFVDGRMVVVAEVAGDAAGFGVSLAALADVSVVSRAARLWFPEIEAGLAPTVVLAWLPGLVGRSRAFWLTASGEPVDGEQAAALGLVGAAVAPDEVPAATARVLASLDATDPRAQLAVKAFLAETAGAPATVTDALAVERLTGNVLRLRGAGR